MGRTELKSKSQTKAQREGEVDRVYRLLKTWLIECRFQPGDSLTEVDLAHRCNTSRTPVREACNRLAQDGWLTRVHHKGHIVTPISVRDVLQIYEFRRILECFAVEKAAQTASQAQLAKLAQIVEVEQRADVDLDEILKLNDVFHLSIAEIAGNQRVVSQLKLTLEFVRRLDTLSIRTHRGWIPHGEIVSALQARRPTEARLAMATHIDYARDRMLDLFVK